jgi:hypothetical protein
MGLSKAIQGSCKSFYALGGVSEALNASKIRLGLLRLGTKREKYYTAPMISS